MLATADLLVNVSGTLRRPLDYRAIPRLAYIDSDPVFTQVKLRLPRGQRKFQRRFANNFSFLNSYTWGKAIDINSDNAGTVSFLNVYDIERYHRGPADYDVTHTFSSSTIYELPWARTRVYGGWQLNGVMQRQSGSPLGFSQALFVGDSNNIVLPSSQRNADRWFNISVFDANVPKKTVASLDRFDRCTENRPIRRHACHAGRDRCVAIARVPIECKCERQ